MNDSAMLIYKHNGKYTKIATPTLLLIKPFVIHMNTRCLEFLEDSEKRFREIKHIVDVGACIGTWTVPFAYGFPGATILSLEPSKRNYPYLVFNTKGLSSVTPRKIAVSDHAGEVQIAVPLKTQRDVIDDTECGLISVHGKSDNFRETVKVDRLDNLVDKKVDWLKIDVEGHERFVLRGAERILKEDRPLLQIEMRQNNQLMASYSVGQLLNDIVSYGYFGAGELEGDVVCFPNEYIDKFKETQT